MFLLLQSPEILLFINHEVCATLKGYVFLRRFGAESVMGTTEVHERINLSFGFQMNKKKEYHANSKWILRNLLALQSR